MSYGIVPIKCPLCYLQFQSFLSMNEHLDKDHLNTCTVCNMGFPDNKSLKKHKITQHREDEDSEDEEDEVEDENEDDEGENDEDEDSSDVEYTDEYSYDEVQAILRFLRQRSNEGDA